MARRRGKLTAAILIAPWRAATLDAEREGAERYRDMTPEQRIAALPTIVEDSASAPTEHGRRFARGWLDEKYRHTKN